MYLSGRLEAKFHHNQDGDYNSEKLVKDLCSDFGINDSKYKVIFEIQTGKELAYFLISSENDKAVRLK